MGCVVLCCVDEGVLRLLLLVVKGLLCKGGGGGCGCGCGVVDGWMEEEKEREGG